MSETKRNKERVDQAWNKLYDRLDAISEGKVKVKCVIFDKI